MTYPNEIEHEKELIKRGRQEIARELEDKKNREYYSATASGRWTFHDYIAVFASHLEDLTAAAEKKTINRTVISQGVNIIRTIIDFLNPHGDYYLSAIGLTTIIDSYSLHKGRMKAVDMAKKIGSAVERELSFQYTVMQGDESVTNTQLKYAQRQYSTPKYRHRATKHTTRKRAENRKVDLLKPLTNQDKARIGLYLLEVAQDLKVVDFRDIRDGAKRKKVMFTNEFVSRVDLMEEILLRRSYKSDPLIDKPKDWETTNGPGKENISGGYHLEAIRQRNPLLRNRVSESAFGEKTVEMLNTLQQTAWRIDERVLEVAETLNDKRLKIDKWKIDSFNVCEFDRPSDRAPEHIAADPEKLKQWRTEAAQKHQEYTIKTKKSQRTRTALAMASKYKHKTFYLSWNCDWRGRFYSQQSWLHFESTGFERSLLKFRDGCKLDEDSLYWCKAAIGAAYLGSSVSFKERIEWTEANQNLIKQIAQDPIGTIPEWEAVKEPWSFLQLCLEWHDVVITKKEKFWKVPIGCDATCSAVQILSAIRRDPIGMKQTNLTAQTDAQKPEDAYSAALELAMKAAIQANKNYLLPYLEHRKVGKQLMKAVYGGTFYSIREGIEDALEEADLDPSNKELNELTRLMMSCYKTAYPAAFEALEYLKDLGNAAHKKGSQSLVWQTPTGDTIECVKHEIETIEIHTGFLGKITHGDFNTEKPDLKKQINAFAPSFVHSLDACVLKEAFSDWTHPLVTIHDCVKVLPKDMDRAFDRLRDGFVSVVSGDLLADLADQFGVSEDALPRLPQLSGDLAEVKMSKYFYN